MTDEEMAEEQVKKWDSILYPELYPVALVKDFIRKAFIAGLEAGRPKWHNVADGDLPKDDIKLAIIEIDDCGYLLCNYRNGFWYDANSGATCAEWITNNIIAWKEIVLPELEKIKEKDK